MDANPRMRALRAFRANRPKATAVMGPQGAERLSPGVNGYPCAREALSGDSVRSFLGKTAPKRAEGAEMPSGRETERSTWPLSASGGPPERSSRPLRSFRSANPSGVSAPLGDGRGPDGLCSSAAEGPGRKPGALSVVDGHTGQVERSVTGRLGDVSFLPCRGFAGLPRLAPQRRPGTSSAAPGHRGVPDVRRAGRGPSG